MQRVVDEQHSRVPVYDLQRGPEHIIGVLYAKDLMRWLRYRVNRTASGRPVTRPSGLEVRHIMREVLVVPETKPLPDLLIEFKVRKRHLGGGGGRVRLDGRAGDGGRCTGATGGRD